MREEKASSTQNLCWVLSLFGRLGMEFGCPSPFSQIKVVTGDEPQPVASCQSTCCGWRGSTYLVCRPTSQPADLFLQSRYPLLAAIVPGEKKWSQMVRAHHVMPFTSHRVPALIGSLPPTTTIRACPTHKEFAEFGLSDITTSSTPDPRDDSQVRTSAPKQHTRLPLFQSLSHETLHLFVSSNKGTPSLLEPRHRREPLQTIQKKKN